eukprot:gene14138-biopygen8074
MARAFPVPPCLGETALPGPFFGFYRVSRVRSAFSPWCHPASSRAGCSPPRAYAKRWPALAIGWRHRGGPGRRFPSVQRHRSLPQTPLCLVAAADLPPSGGEVLYGGDGACGAYGAGEAGGARGACGVCGACGVRGASRDCGARRARREAPGSAGAPGAVGPVSPARPTGGGVHPPSPEDTTAPASF